MENREKQKEIHELAKQMSEAISTEIEQRYIEDEAKLQAVLIESGWRRASEVAEEIFAELERDFQKRQAMYDREAEKCGWHLAMRREYEGLSFGVDYCLEKIAKLKKKYIGKDTNVTTKESEKDNDTH